MLCPKCNSELRRKWYHNTEIDFCEKCKGAWFDDGELVSVIESLAASSDIPDAAIDLDKDVVGQYGISEAQRMCPHCRSEMSKLNYAYDSNIILDKCKLCNGTWVDGSEIMRLAIFRKGNPLLDKMGAAIAHDRGEMLKERYSDKSTSWTSGRYGGGYGGGVGIILPISDNQSTHTFPFVVCGLIALNVLVFILQITCMSGSEVKTFYQQFGLVPDTAFASIQGGTSFFTSMFIHGSWFHLLGNMLFLWIFADNIEDRFGHWQFLLLYLLFGVGADFTHIIFSPHSLLPAIGASGAISGTMGAYFILYPSAKIKTYCYGRIIDIPAFLYLGGWLALQMFYSGIFSGGEVSGEGGGVAWFAHIGGFIIGAAAGAVIRYISLSGKNDYIR